MPVDPIVSLSASEGPHNVPLSQILNSAVLSQGLLADIPALPVGAMYFATDTQTMYVGTLSGNIPTTTPGMVDSPSGITITDIFGNQLQMASTYVSYGAANSGGGVFNYFDGTLSGSSISDGQGNALLLGTLWFGQNINLTNEASHAGLINTTGDTTFVYGNPLFIGVAGGLGISISPSGIILAGVLINPAAPTTGQVLTATSPTGAGWATPAGGGAITKTARIDMGTIASATPSLVTTFNWPTAFADNNYTIVGSVVILETPPAGAATAIVCVGSIELLASGTGFNFVICNADGLPHHVIAQFVAVHD